MYCAVHEAQSKNSCLSFLSMPEVINQSNPHVAAYPSTVWSHCQMLTHVCHASHLPHAVHSSSKPYSCQSKDGKEYNFSNTLRAAAKQDKVICLGCGMGHWGCCFVYRNNTYMHDTKINGVLFFSHVPWKPLRLKKQLPNLVKVCASIIERRTHSQGLENTLVPSLFFLRFTGSCCLLILPLIFCLLEIILRGTYPQGSNLELKLTSDYSKQLLEQRRWGGQLVKDIAAVAMQCPSQTSASFHSGKVSLCSWPDLRARSCCYKEWAASSTIPFYSFLFHLLHGFSA